MRIKSLEQGLMNRKCSELPVINIAVNISQLTEVLSPPDIHLGIILSQVVKPGLVNHKDSSSYDGRPGSKEMREVTRDLKKLEAPPHGPRVPGPQAIGPRIPCMQTPWGLCPLCPWGPEQSEHLDCTSSEAPVTDAASQQPPRPCPSGRRLSPELTVALTLWAWWGLSGLSSAPEGSAPI